MESTKQKHKRWRKNFNEVCLKRDQNRCAICKAVETDNIKLDVHHITDRHEMPNGGYVLENGITLCDQEICSNHSNPSKVREDIKSCHKRAESWHTHIYGKPFDGFSPDDLYRKINSSKSLAEQKSKLLI
jgi:hypothetical protein